MVNFGNHADPTKNTLFTPFSDLVSSVANLSEFRRQHVETSIHMTGRLKHVVWQSAGH